VPVGVVHVKHLGQPTPADIFYERGFFFFRRRTFLGIERPQRLDGGEVPLEFLFRAAFTDTVGFRDAIAIEIAGWFVLMLPMATFWLFSVFLMADCKVADC
jgi:hypothetical protein